jgi:hypothetical protein
MRKPQKPTKRIEMTGSVRFYFDHVSNKVSLSYFLGWVKENIPKGAKDITLSMDEDYDDYDGTIINCGLEVGYKYRAKNPNYHNELQKYERKLRKWKREQCK